MGALYKRLATVDPKAQWVDPPGDEEQKAQAWREWEETLDFLRFLLEDTAAWQDTFTAGLAALLPPLEILAMPSWMGRGQWIGGDATLDKVGAIDWNTKEFLVTDAEPLMQQLRAAATSSSMGFAPTCELQNN